MPKVIEDKVKFNHSFIVSSYTFGKKENDKKYTELFKKFPYEEREILWYLVRRGGNFDELYQNYQEVKEFIDKLIRASKYDDTTIGYIRKNKPLAILTKQQIFSRLAILSCGGIDEYAALHNSYLLYFYNDEMIYLAIRALKKVKQVISPADIRAYLSDPNNELKGPSFTPMIIKTITDTYKLNLEK